MVRENITLRDVVNHETRFALASSLREPVHMNLSQRIRSAREEAGLTQTQLGEAIGVGQPAVSEWEKSARNMPSVEMIRRVAAATDKSAVWLAFGEDYIFTNDEVELIQKYRLAPANARLMAKTALEIDLDGHHPALSRAAS